MLRLLLLRHAKSSWDAPDVADADRPLSPRGVRAAELMAEAIAIGGYLPDRILCSPARRTRETLTALQPKLAKTVVVSIVPGLYEPAGRDYREVIANDGGSGRKLLLIGHNPAIQATALALVPDPGGKAGFGTKFPTCGLVVADFAVDSWAKLDQRSGQLVAFMTPKSLEDGSTGGREDG